MPHPPTPPPKRLHLWLAGGARWGGSGGWPSSGRKNDRKMPQMAASAVRALSLALCGTGSTTL
eukprot:9156532-Alexandrium_andersonii.AAC.1